MGLQATGSSPGWVPLRSGLGKLLTPVCLCHQAVLPAKEQLFSDISTYQLMAKGSEMNTLATLMQRGTAQITFMFATKRMIRRQ